MLIRRLFRTFGEGDLASGSDTKPADGTKPADSGAEKKFTQEEVDKIIHTRSGRWKQERETLISQLKMLEQAKGLTEEEKSQLQAQITTLEESVLTKEQQAAKKEKQLLDQHAASLRKATEEANTWKSQFQNAEIRRALADAAGANQAESVEQIQMMFGSAAYLAEDRGTDGKPAGFTPRLKFRGYTGEDDANKTLGDLDLPIAEALKRIKSDGLHANLFKHGATGGTGDRGSGQGSGGSSGEPTLASCGNDKARYTAALAKFWETHNFDGSPKAKRG